MKPKVTAEKISQLREISGCGMMQCRRALERCDANMDKAIEFLRKDGIALFIHKKIDKN